MFFKKYFEKIKKDQEIINIASRKRAGELIQLVLAKRMLTRQALLNFPKDAQDLSVRASWHALCYIEADEEMRIKDPDYALVQDEFLSKIATTLSLGEELPKEVIESYTKYHAFAQIPHQKGFLGFLASLSTFLNVKK